MPTNPEVYPITAQFEEELKDLAHLPAWLKDAAISTLGEYEHGTTEVEEVEDGITLCGYRAVLLDFLLTLNLTEEGPPKCLKK